MGATFGQWDDMVDLISRHNLPPPRVDPEGVAAKRIGAQHAVCILSGAGIREGVHLEGQVRQVDVAPTISYLLGIDVPRDAEGGVIYEALEEPNWHLK